MKGRIVDHASYCSDDECESRVTVTIHDVKQETLEECASDHVEMVKVVEALKCLPFGATVSQELIKVMNKHVAMIILDTPVVKGTDYGSNYCSYVPVWDDIDRHGGLFEIVSAVITNPSD